MNKPGLTICTLLQGNKPALAIRCVDALLRWPADFLEVRIGLDAVDPATTAYISSLIKAGRVPKRQVYISTVPLGYYPMMRRILYDPGQPIATKYVAWFDCNTRIASDFWLSNVLQELEDADIVGDCQVAPLAGNQHLWIRDQPWYTGKEMGQRFRCHYPSDLYWVADYAILEAQDWPPDLDYCDTDVMLGALCYQQSLRLKNFTQGVDIVDVPAVHDFQRLGYDYDPGGARQLHVQQPPPRPVSRAYLKLDL